MAMSESQDHVFRDRDANMIQLPVPDICLDLNGVPGR